MRIRALGHAGLEVEGAAGRVLIDPWMSPEGAFQGSWHQFPDNSHLVTDTLFSPSAIVVTHEHLDHLDPWFLQRVPSDVPVVIPTYPSPVLRRKILAAKDRPVIEVGPGDRAEVGGSSISFVSELSPMNHDSAVVVQNDGATLLDLNDTRLSPLQLREIMASVGERIDVLAFQGAGASWYPICYDYSREQATRIGHQKRLAKLAYTERVIRVVDPSTGLPFAGPPCFLDPELRRYNSEMDGGIFPDQAQVANWLADRGITNIEVLLPGDGWDVADARKLPDPQWAGFSFDARESYIDAYADRRRQPIADVIARNPEPSGSLWPAFESYFGDVLRLSAYFNERIGMRVGFDITGPGGGRWAVDFRPGHEGVDAAMGDVGYCYSLESRWLAPILAGEVPWEDFLLSLRFKARREPDLYNDHLLGLLKFADQVTLNAVEAWETSERDSQTILVHADGETYEVQRFCPHAGNDLLESGEVLPGRILRCLAHHYEFDLETGSCVNGVCHPLLVRRA